VFTIRLLSFRSEPVTDESDTHCKNREISRTRRTAELQVNDEDAVERQRSNVERNVDLRRSSGRGAREDDGDDGEDCDLTCNGEKSKSDEGETDSEEKGATERKLATRQTWSRNACKLIERRIGESDEQFK
jgi:hypothetical protein